MAFQSSKPNERILYKIMATGAIPRPCKICRKLTTNKNGFCDEHKSVGEEQVKRWQAQYDLRRGSPSRRGYDATWVKVRKTYLMQHPLCEQCEKEGRITPAREVHHIIALQDGGNRLDESNFMAVCHACHQKFTQEEIENRRKKEG